MEKKIIIKGAKEHNLKNINLEIPKEKLIVITGVSGSGKSTLAFDTIYAEGQRRYIESLSTYARQFLGQLEKPDVDFIDGLSPAIAIEQKGISKNPRSTVGTTTEIYDYLRLLYGRIGKPYCYNCGREITSQTIDQIVDNILSYPEGEKLIILAPIVRDKKGTHKNLFIKLQKEGFLRVRVDGTIYLLEDEIDLDKNKKHNIEIVIDRIKIDSSRKSRITDSVEQAINLGEGFLIALIEDQEILFSTKLSCPYCNISFPEISPRLFSFNSPYGACPKCHGLGYFLEFDEELLVPDPELSIKEGAIEILENGRVSVYDYPISDILRILKFFQISPKTPWKNIPTKIKKIIMYGDDDLEFEGVIPFLKRQYEFTESEDRKEFFEKYMVLTPCKECNGKRLRKEALSVKVGGKTIDEITSMPIKDVYKFLKTLKLTDTEKHIVGQVLKEILSRLEFLIEVGVDYLTLDRMSSTLSGGESQRIRLATQIGSRLSGVLYVLDEPTIGLHPRDNQRLIKTLKRLRDIGNTVIVVEHDEETIKAADFIVDLGPRAGKNGGEVVYAGDIEGIKKEEKSLTGLYLSKKEKIDIPHTRRKGNGKSLTLIGLTKHNLKNITVNIPLGKLVCITGVSGSGKSTLLNEILYPSLVNALSKTTRYKVDGIKEIRGIENIDKVINIDQSPIGRTPRSNPATYTGVFQPIRELFASLPEAKMKGYKPGRFSFNVKGGRCEACKGEGVIKIEMHFLPDVYITCDVCKGKRYNRETLEVKFKGKSIADVLNMTVDEARELFKNIPKIKRRLDTLHEVGLGYIELGQPATTLSGGEAQRVKLSKELSKIATGNTLYILDEPTTGLHFDDVKKLLKVLHLLVDKGNTVLVIEHNLDVIKTADWIIDLGPEGGDEGGYIVAEGTPEDIAKCKRSHTGKFLKEILK